MKLMRETGCGRARVRTTEKERERERGREVLSKGGLSAIERSDGRWRGRREWGWYVKGRERKREEERRGGKRSQRLRDAQ